MPSGEEIVSISIPHLKGSTELLTVIAVGSLGRLGEGDMKSGEIVIVKYLLSATSETWSTLE
jgi:hypothetical protein